MDSPFGSGSVPALHNRLLQNLPLPIIAQVPNLATLGVFKGVNEQKSQKIDFGARRQLIYSPAHNSNHGCVAGSQASQWTPWPMV